MAKQLTRNEVPEHEKWNLQHIYPNHELWEKDFKKLAKLIKVLKTYNDNINGAKDLYAYLLLDEEADELYSRLAIYSKLKGDEDTSLTEAQELSSRIRELGVSYSSATSFFTPLLLSWEKEKLDTYINEEPRLDYFKKDLYESFKYKPHVLSKEKSELLSELSESLAAPSLAFKALNTTDLKFGTVKDENGEEIELTHGRARKLLESTNREVRKETFFAYHGAYKKMKTTFASLLSSNIKNNVKVSRLKKYPSALEKSLFSDEVPLSVYENLIKATREHAKDLDRYMSIRKQVMGLDELHGYDTGVPLVENNSFNLTFDEAYELMLKGLAPLGEDYLNVLKQAREERWIDVRETENKQTGAYKYGPYSDYEGKVVHPYVLLNHQDNLDSAFTLVHEMGHALHSYYSNQTQPKNQASYVIFVAEVASTVNEVLLMKYLLNSTEDKNVKRYLLNHYIDQFRGTLFTQVMFAEFEKTTHEMAQNGVPLTVESFSKVYEQLYRDYNGKTLVLDDEIKYGWSRIPHFYTPFYVYKYATGFSAANAIVKSILEEGEPAVKRYLEFLKTGGSDYPIELLKITGVDLSTTKPVEDALSLFKELVDEFEELMLEKK